MDNCIFCKIGRGEIPSYKVWEDEKYFAFLDRSPATEGHTLVIPKQHYRWVYDVPEFGEYWEAVLQVTRIVEKALQPKWINYLTHVGVPHAHIHILPRFEEDVASANPAPKQKPMAEVELEKVIKKLRVRS